jgi:hypothetical protein
LRPWWKRSMRSGATWFLTTRASVASPLVRRPRA